MKTIFLLLFFGCSACLNAIAQTGKFYIELDAGNKPTVKPIGKSNVNNNYETLQLCFSKSIENTKITFYDAPDKAIAVFKDAKIIDLADGTDEDTSVITILKANGNYIIDGTTSPNIPLDFTIAFNSNHTSVFHLGNQNSAYRPGYLLYDAFYIREHWKAQKGDTIQLILKSYGINDTNDLKLNKYLNSILKGLYNLPKEVEAQGTGSLSISSMISSVGNLDVTNFADGLAKFIVERTKEELNITFFNKFKEVLSDPKYVDLKTVFPETYGVLMVIDNQIYNYEDYLQALRNAFDQDLSNLPENLPSIINNHSSYFDANPGLKVILQSSFYIAQQVQLKEHPGQMIANYPVDEFMGTNTEINQNVASSFKTLQLISKSFKSRTDSLTNYWANDTLIKKLFNDDTAVKIYIGLLVQQAKKNKIVFKGKEGKEEKELWRIIDSSYTITRGYEEYKNFFRTVSSKIRDIEKEIDALKKIDKDSLKIEKYHSIAGKALDLMDHLITVEKMPYFPKNLDIAKKAGIYIYSAHTASDIVVDVNRKQYASAIMKTVMLWDTIFQKDGLDTFAVQTFAAKIPKVIKLREAMFDLQKKSKELTAQLGRTPTDDLKKKLQDILTKKDSISKEIAKIISDFRDTKPFKKWADSIRNELSMTIKSLLKYGTFMAAVVDAKTSDDVEAAIEAAALPVGSARIKRESTFNIALNAYCGPYMGYERVYGLDPKWMSAGKSTVNSYGLTAPVGISVSYGGNCRKAKNHSSYSLFLSVIDVGAVASFRFKDTTTEILPTIQLKNILSPGIFFSYGIPTLPISVNAGWQMGPLLRKVGTQVDENTYSDRYGRISLSICIDIPIVNFYTFTSSKKPKYRL